MEWKNTIGHYMVSNTGIVFNTKTNKEMKPDTYQRYARVALTVDGVRYKKLIHRLVAEAFIPNPEDKPYVNHKNGGIYDNRVENLEWATQQENVQHAYATGLIGEKTQRQIESARENQEKAAQARVVLTEEQVYEIDSKLNEGYLIKTLAREYNVSVNTISRIKNRRGHYASYFTT